MAKDIKAEDSGNASAPRLPVRNAETRIDQLVRELGNIASERAAEKLKLLAAENEIRTLRDKLTNK